LAWESFDRFLTSVFAWCGTYSLAAESKRVPLAEIQVGDFLAHPGSPGNAVLAADLARDQEGNLKALILQGFMPAQSAYIPAPGDGKTWFGRETCPARKPKCAECIMQDLCPKKGVKQP